MVNFKINRLPNKHIVDRYLETVQSLGVINDGKGLDYFVSPDDEVDVKTLPTSHHNGYVGFVIGGKYKTKCLPVEKIISISKKINSPIILFGGKEDMEKANTITKVVGCKIFNACGRYNINQAASLVKQAKKIITHDTGLMHIAAAFKKDIVSIWGNTIPEFGMYPYLLDGNDQIIEIKDLSCRPCSKLGFDKCPKGHFKCMNLINEETMVNFS